MTSFTTSDMKQYQGHIFGEGEKCLFRFDGESYRFAIEDDDIDLYDDNILGVNFDLKKAMGDVKILNFNKVKTISEKAFDTLLYDESGLQFHFEGEQIRIREGAFGENFQQLSLIKGLNGKLDLILHSGCFNKFNEIIDGLEFENVNIYLYGKWSKKIIWKLIEKIKDGKIHAASEEGKFKIDEKFDKLDSETLEKLSKNMIDAIVENASEVQATRRENKKGKTRVDTIFASWNKLKKESAENGNVCKKMIDFVINKMAEENFLVKAKVNIDETEVKEGKLELNNAKCFEEIKLISEDKGLISVLKLLSNENNKSQFNGKLLKNDKKNRDAVKDEVKQYIKSNWTKVIETGIRYSIILDNDKLKEKLNGNEAALKEIQEENRIMDKKTVDNIETAEKYVGELIEKVKKMKEVKMKISEGKEIIQSLIVIGKEYKHKNKKLVKCCYECIKSLKSDMKNNIV